MSPAGRWFLIILVALIMIRQPHLVHQIVIGIIQLFSGQGS